MLQVIACIERGIPVIAVPVPQDAKAHPDEIDAWFVSTPANQRWPQVVPDDSILDAFMENGEILL